MPRLPIAIAMTLFSSLATAGGGDPYYFGLLKDKLHSFEFDAYFFDGTPVSNPAGSELAAVPVTIFPGLTSFTEDPVRPAPPPPVITGCLVLLENTVPTALICTDSTSNPAFRKAIYAVVGAGKAEKGVTFKCVSNCTEKIPRQFKRYETATGD